MLRRANYRLTMNSRANPRKFNLTYYNLHFHKFGSSSLGTAAYIEGLDYLEFNSCKFDRSQGTNGGIVC